MVALIKNKPEKNTKQATRIKIMPSMVIMISLIRATICLIFLQFLQAESWDCKKNVYVIYRHAICVHK